METMPNQPGMFRLFPSSSDNRIFVYEVAGLRQHEQINKNCYPIRDSSNLFFSVPFSRMNAQMRRIALLGGKIVRVRALAASDRNPSTS